MLDSKLPNTETSIFTIMSNMATDYNAINLSQGFPNFEIDASLRRLVNNAMGNGYNQYAPMPGDLGLREQIASKIETLYGKRFNPDTEITITAGATQAIFTILAATIREHDEVIIFTPAYDCYKPTISLFGGKTVSIQLKAPNYAPNWDEVEQAITSRTRMIIINTPHNPTGTVLTKNDLLQLQRIITKNELFVLSDEVYEHIIFDGIQHQSVARFPKLAERSFITASFGKTFHATGWKMGYCVAPEYLSKEFRKIHQYNVFCVNHPIQKALATYLEDQGHFLSLPAFYQKKRDFFINAMKGSRFKIIPSKGTYFQLLDFSEISKENDVAFTEWLTKKKGVATIPTSVFNTNNEDFKQIRVCFAKTEETLRRATELLKGI